MNLPEKTPVMVLGAVKAEDRLEHFTSPPVAEPKSGETLTDLDMTKLCAEAMGWKHLGAVGVEPPNSGQPDPKGLWCLSGGNDWWQDPKGFKVCAPCSGIPDPLNNDVDAMALAKKLYISMSAPDGETSGWDCYTAQFLNGDPQYACSSNADLNRAIVECVAKMQATRTTESRN